MKREAVATGGVAGAITTLITWVLGTTGVTVPAEVAVAIATVVGFAVGRLFQPQPKAE